MRTAYLVHDRQRLADVDGYGRAVNPRVGAEMTQSHVRIAAPHRDNGTSSMITWVLTLTDRTG